jgi:hypothetical protein
MSAGDGIIGEQFQSTPLREGRHRILVAQSVQATFQSTPLREGRLLNSSRTSFSESKTLWNTSNCSQPASCRETSQRAFIACASSAPLPGAAWNVTTSRTAMASPQAGRETYNLGLDLKGHLASALGGIVAGLRT